MRPLVVAALVSVAAALFAPAASQAAAPCWQRVLDDWRDGRIDGEYPVHCYRDALSHLPEDLRVYGSAEADIQRALTRELAERSTQASARTPAVATTRRSATRSKSAARSARRTLAMHSSTRTKAKQQPKARRAAAPRPTAPAAGRSSLPVTLLLVFGAAAVVAAAALSWRRAAAVRRRRQDV